MAFLRFKRRLRGPAATGQVQQSKKTIRRAPPVAMEVKLLAMEALEAGMTAQEIGDLLSLSGSTIHNWRAAYAEGGVLGLSRKASAKAIRNQCSVLEERIIAQRQANPDHGVRRIRDDLRRQEGLEVSAEKVRTTVNEAGLGKPPPQPHRRPPQVRRFERVSPNALWQIDIFTCSACLSCPALGFVIPRHLPPRNRGHVTYFLEAQQDKLIWTLQANP